MGTVMHIRPGRLRMIHHDDYTPSGAVPRRASRVEPIQDGPDRGKWMVDMSPLGPEFQYCLWPPYDTRRAALAAETTHLEEVWIRGKRR
jgi:hypothetical protein